MTEATKINELGTIILDGVSIRDGQIEVHVPIDECSEQLESVLDDCTRRYMNEHNNVNSFEDLYFDISIVFTCGGFRNGRQDEAEFQLAVIVWQRSDDVTGKDTAEFYEEIPVSLSEEDSKKIRRIIWDKLGEMLLG